MAQNANLLAQIANPTGPQNVLQMYQAGLQQRAYQDELARGGQHRNLLAEVGRIGSTGDYGAAASAAFAGGEPEMGSQFISLADHVRAQRQQDALNAQQQQLYSTMFADQGQPQAGSVPPPGAVQAGSSVPPVGAVPPPPTPTAPPIMMGSYSTSHASRVPPDQYVYPSTTVAPQAPGAPAVDMTTAQAPLQGNREQARALWLAGDKAGAVKAMYPGVDTGTSDIQNWRMARSQGYQGNLLDYQLALKSAGAAQINTMPDLPVVQTDARGVPDQASQAEFLKKLPRGTSDLIKKVANYEWDISKVTSLKGGERETVAKLVSMYDPSYDQTQYKARSAMRSSATSGPYSQLLASTNLVIQHADALLKAHDQLQNFGPATPSSAGSGDYGYLNQPLNKIHIAALGYKQSPALGAFNTAADAIATETAKAFKGTGASAEEEIKAWRTNVSASMSSEQIHASLGMLIGNLLASRLDTFQNLYTAAMGKPYDFKILTPHTKQVLGEYGIDIGGPSVSGTPLEFVPYRPGQTAPQSNGPPPEAVNELRQNPATAHQFDEIFGSGAAQRALGGQ